MDRSYYGPFSGWAVGNRLEWGVLAAQSQVMLRLLMAIDIACAEAGRSEFKADTEYLTAAASLLDGMIRLVISDPGAMGALAPDEFSGRADVAILAGLSRPLDAIAENCGSLADDLAADRLALPLAVRFQQIALHARHMRHVIGQLSFFGRTLLPGI